MVLLQESDENQAVCLTLPVKKGIVKTQKKGVEETN